MLGGAATATAQLCAEYLFFPVHMPDPKGPGHYNLLVVCRPDLVLSDHWRRSSAAPPCKPESAQSLVNRAKHGGCIIMFDLAYTSAADVSAHSLPQRACQ